MTTNSTQVMSENVSHSLFHIDTSPKYIKKICFTNVLYLHVILLSLSSFNSNPFFNHTLSFSIIPLRLLFSSFCVRLSIYLSIYLSLSLCLCVCVSLSLSVSSFHLRSRINFLCYPFHFLSLSFVLSFSPCAIEIKKAVRHR